MEYTKSPQFWIGTWTTHHLRSGTDVLLVISQGTQSFGFPDFWVNTIAAEGTTSGPSEATIRVAWKHPTSTICPIYEIYVFPSKTRWTDPTSQHLSTSLGIFQQLTWQPPSSKTSKISSGTTGPLWATGDQEKLVDTNGAGDAFVGGFLAALSKGKDMEVHRWDGSWISWGFHGIQWGFNDKWWIFLCHGWLPEGNGCSWFLF